MSLSYLSFFLPLRKDSSVKLCLFGIQFCLTQEVQKKINKEPGDIIQVTIKEDNEPRTVELPDDLKNLLEQLPEAMAVYETLSYTHKKEYVRWITEAKKAETRENRVHKAIELLLKGTKTPDNQKK